MKPEELIGKCALSVFPKMVNSIVYPYFCKVMAKKVPVHFEHNSVQNNAWFENHLYPLEDGVAGYCCNITERKQAEMELQKSRQETADILESIGGGFVCLDDNLRYTYVNNTAEKMFGRSREAIVGQKFGDLFSGLNPLVLKKCRQALQEQKEQQLEIYSVSFRKWLMFLFYPTKEGVSIHFRDISKRKQYEEALRQSEVQFKTIFQNSPVMMAIIREEDDQHIEVNQKWLDVMGYNREEVIGHTLAELNIISGISVKIWGEANIRVRNNKKLLNYEAEFRTKTGDIINTLISTGPIKLHGEACRLSTVIKDITKEKKLEAEVARLDQLRLIGEMAAGIGHEIRNPMTSVRGFLQLFLEKEEFFNYKSIFEVMIEELDRANAIITEYLNVANNKKSDCIEQKLNSIIETIYPLILADAMENNKYISLELTDLPGLLLDEKEIRQLLHNLVRNGLEAMEPGGCVTVKTFMDGDDAVLAVIDQGKGIKPELLNKIGTPFFTTKDTGTGLGLAVCYSIAQRHKAKIDIESSPAGTAFFVRFKVS